MDAANWVSSTGWTNAQSDPVNLEPNACAGSAVKIDDLSWNYQSGANSNHVSGHWVADDTSHMFWTHLANTWGIVNPPLGCC